MNNIGNVGDINTTSLPSQSGGESVTQAGFTHSQLGAGTMSGLNSSMFEEAAMNIASSRKIENKDDKKDKESLQKLLDARVKKVPDMPGAEQLDNCLQKLKNSFKSKNLNDESIKEFINEYSGDATHQYLALEDLIAYLLESNNDDDKALASQLKDYNHKFYEENKQNIQAGVNISGIAVNFSESSDLGNVGELRDIWRSALQVPEIKNAQDAFQFAMEKSGGYEKVGEGIKWMTDALARELDLAQSERSVDSTQMLHVRSQLEYVFGVKTTYEQCLELESKLPELIRNERNG